MYNHNEHDKLNNIEMNIKEQEMQRFYTVNSFLYKHLGKI